jgi:Cyclomaltodextrinase, N-terminal.
MRKTLLSFILFIIAVSMNAASKIDKIEPSFWYVGMKNPELQLMVYGKNISSCDVSANYPGVNLSSVVKLESPNYLMLYLTLDKDVKAGNMELTFTLGNKKEIKYYELKTRAKKGLKELVLIHQTFFTCLCLIDLLTEMQQMTMIKHYRLLLPTEKIRMHVMEEILQV